MAVARADRRHLHLTAVFDRVRKFITRNHGERANAEKRPMNFDNDNPPPPGPQQPPVPWEIIEAQSPAEQSLAEGRTNPTQDSGPSGAPLPEDLRVPWGWVDLLILVALFVGGPLVVSVPILIGFMLAGVSRAQLSHPTSAYGLFVILDQVVLSFAILAYLAA